MPDFFELDFLDIESDKSGDAIPIRVSIDGITTIYLTDAGFKKSGEGVVRHISDYYDRPTTIDHVIVTHPDRDHAGGIIQVLEEFEVLSLWMLRPWRYAEEIIHRFDNYNSIQRLESRLRSIYPVVTDIETYAVANDIPIYEPFQGNKIGHFSVAAPSRERYLDLIVTSEKTPESSNDKADTVNSFLENTMLGKVVNFVRAAWGDENFSKEETSSENEMSVVQYAEILDKKILLTGDTGRQGLAETIAYLERLGVPLPGIDYFQIPHHGSRRNVSSETLDALLGKKTLFQQSEANFSAYVSAAKKDKHHPRKAVTRAIYHRGGKVLSTEGQNIVTGPNRPPRDNYSPLTPLPYPEDQEG